MYNRYIPRPDGSYQKKAISQSPSPPQENQTQDLPNTPPAASVPDPVKIQPQSGNPAVFLRRLLPKEFDTGDLIIVLLLLLMAGDSEDGKNNALLTLALYFFL